MKEFKQQKEQKIDLDLNIEGKKISTKKMTNAKEVREFFAFADKCENEVNQFDYGSKIDCVIKELDYIYGENVDVSFWSTLDINLLNAIMLYVTNEVIGIKKK